jgi:hypothetical protein
VANANGDETFRHGRRKLGVPVEGLAHPKGVGPNPGNWRFGDCPQNPDASSNSPGMGSGFWPPGQNPELWRGIPPHLHPTAPKHDVCRVAFGILPWVVESNRYRTDRLRCLGNAVSPPAGAVAWRVLAGRILILDRARRKKRAPAPTRGPARAGRRSSPPHPS